MKETVRTCSVQAKEGAYLLGVKAKTHHTCLSRRQIDVKPEDYNTVSYYYYDSQTIPAAQ